MGLGAPSSMKIGRRGQVGNLSYIFLRVRAAERRQRLRVRLFL